eukprot:CAMPEP_0170730146 /NCGR_PEP_ID=MMETSP0437-20130122/385_1 /TAXON_ID=0 /ORGANISM="Sexangularia sp." /LENGTH=64 /DNA_ID=CAMNT_0011068341 /DNA_START=13 /DNA_END=207 /DNA_ORIENTATION=-
MGPIHETLSHCTLNRMCSKSEINGKDSAEDGSDDSRGDGAGSDDGLGAATASAGRGVGGPAATK